MAQAAQPPPPRGGKKPGRPRKKQTGLDTSGLKFQGIGSWQTIRFHKHARRRDHRKMVLLVETGQRREKFVYEWRLDRSRWGDVTVGLKLVSDLPPNTGGGTPIVKPRANARTTEVNARGRAIRYKLHHTAAWQRRYDRRPITGSVNYALKRRFGDRLWSRGLRSQRKEFAFRALVYNSALKCRSMVRDRVQGRDS